MKIEIFSDVVCPFCYIGKRHFEIALEQFEGKKTVEIEWLSYQLDPSTPKSSGGVNVYEYLAKRKGISYETSVKMHKQVVEMAKNAGLDYHFEKAVVTNSFDAHRLILYAKTKNKGNEVEELLFKSYFIEGKNISDHLTLIEIGKAAGLPESEVSTLFKGDQYSDEVKKDIQDAEQIGISGVPFFIFDRKFAVSGAQPVEVFLNTLKRAAAENK